MNIPKPHRRVFGLLLAALLTLACLTGCGGGLFAEKLTASELYVSPSNNTLEVHVDQTVYFAVAAIGYSAKDKNDDAEEPEKKTYELELKDNEKGKDLWESRVFGDAIYQTEGQPDGNVLDIQNNFYVLLENEEDASLPYLILGPTNINFITNYVQKIPAENGAGIVRVFAVKGLKAGSSTWTFTSGDQSQTVTINVMA